MGEHIINVFSEKNIYFYCSLNLHSCSKSHVSKTKNIHPAYFGHKSFP